jgi:hypothetical protein
VRWSGGEGMAAREDAYTTEVKYIVAAPALLTIYLLAFPVGSTTGVDRFTGSRPHLISTKWNAVQLVVTVK